jgi:hypothetical protein
MIRMHERKFLWRNFCLRGTVTRTTLLPRRLENPIRTQAAVAARHIRKASSRTTRSMRRDVRWRWTSNVLWTAADATSGVRGLRHCGEVQIFTRPLCFIAIGLIASMVCVAAYPQDGGGYVAPELNRPTPGQLLDQDYLTSTGETVPQPGVPQSSGETPLDRFIQQQNDRIDNSICKGC